MVGPRDSDSSPRLWPLFAILIAAVVAIAYTEWGEGVDRQSAHMTSAAIGLCSLLLIFLWLLLFSRMRFGRRIGWSAVIVVVVAGFFGLFRIRGVNGDLVPIFVARWETGAELNEVEVAGAQPAPVLPGLADYPQFFGPMRDGKLTGPRLAKNWLAEPPVELWRQPVGVGWSGFAVAGALAVTQEQRGEDEAVTCYEVATGRVRWVHRDRARYVSTVAGDGPRATPTIHDGHVFTLGSTGILNCLQLASGRRVWRRDILADASAAVPSWGVASSPLVIGEDVLVIAGGKAGQSLVAYSRESGKPTFSGGDSEAHWSSPVLGDLAGRSQVLVFNGDVFGHDATTGAVLWSHPWKRQHPHVSLPIICGADRVLVSSGYGTGSELLRVTESGGAWQVETIWKSRRMKAKFCNLIVHQGSIYGLDDGIFACVDLATGRRRWKGGRYGHGQQILVGGLLLVTAEDGRIVLLEAAPDAHRELATHTVFAEKTWNPPALAGRYLLVRNDQEAVCLRLPVVER